MRPIFITLLILNAVTAVACGPDIELPRDGGRQYDYETYARDAGTFDAGTQPVLTDEQRCYRECPQDATCDYRDGTCYQYR